MLSMPDICLSFCAALTLFSSPRMHACFHPAHRRVGWVGRRSAQISVKRLGRGRGTAVIGGDTAAATAAARAVRRELVRVTQHAVQYVIIIQLNENGSVEVIKRLKT
jgi:hypothetical protein